MKLLNPGPVSLSDRVRQALLKPDLCHREQEFIDLQSGIRADLLAVYDLSPDTWASVVLTGSGTAAMEAMMTSLIPADGRVLILENGVYGERLTRIARLHGIDHVALHHEWGEAINLTGLEDKLRSETPSHVALVQHETTTGRLNDIAAIADLCHKHGDIPLLIDSVSAFGAEEIRFDDWNMAGCAATANKCLHGVPGTSFVIVNRKAVESISGTAARTLYLDLATYLTAQDSGGTPFTQSVQTFYALSEALAELKDMGGWQVRQKRYWSLMDIVRCGFEKLNITPRLQRQDSSCVLNAFHLPEHLTYQELHDKLKTAGYVIYAGQGGLVKSLFRISCMGEITKDDMKRLVDEVAKIIRA